jgi:hypothetical protein
MEENLCKLLVTLTSIPITSRNFWLNAWHRHLNVRVQAFEMISRVTTFTVKKLRGLTFPTHAEASHTSDAVMASPVKFSDSKRQLVNPLGLPLDTFFMIYLVTTTAS